MPARKRVAATVRIQLEAGQASPGKVGQSPSTTTRSFDLQLRTPPTSARSMRIEVVDTG